MRMWIKSVRHALSGLIFALREERNFQIEFVIALLVLAGMAYFPLSLIERTTLILVIFVVLTLELVNTAIEKTMDILKPRVHPYVRVVKDLTAAAVLIASIGAALIGYIIFAPHVLSLLGGWFSLY